MIWYDHSGKPDPARPFTGLYQVGIRPINNAGDDKHLKVVCDGKILVDLAAIYLWFRADIIEQILESKVSDFSITDMHNKIVTEEVTQADRVNLNNFVSHGRGWTPPSPVFADDCEMTYIFVVSEELKARWDVIKPKLRETIQQREKGRPLPILMFLDDDIWFRPARTRISSSAENVERIVEALDVIPTKRLFVPSVTLANEVADYANDRNSLTLIIFIASELPPSFASVLARRASRYGLRINVVWCGTGNPDEETNRAMLAVSSETGGVMSSFVTGGKPSRVR